MEEYMDILIIAIPILIGVLGNKTSKDKTTEKKKKPKKSSTSTSHIMPSQDTISVKTLSVEAEKWRVLAKENIEKARSRVKTEMQNRVSTNYAKNLEISQTVQNKILNRNSNEQIQQRRMESQHTSILERAKENVKDFEKDVEA